MDMRALPNASVIVVGLLCLVAGGSVTVVAQVAAEPQVARVNGIDMSYEVVGEGEPLVLLHSGTQTGRMFDPFVDRLSAGYRLIIPDLRGHGGSTNPDGIWTTRQFAFDVFALLDQLGVERFKAIGASAGGMTLLHMATQQPQRIEAMVVVGVGTYLPVSCRETLAQTDGDALPEAVWERYRAIHPRGDEQIRALFDWVASLAESYNDMTFTPSYLATISARTLVVHGDRDYCFPALMAWDIYEAVPDAYLWVVPNGGHVPITGEQAPQFTETVLAFLNGDWQG
jgi:pimeloyl-ACP methyl ester carboxylesterase